MKTKRNFDLLTSVLILVLIASAGYAGYRLYTLNAMGLSLRSLDSAIRSTRAQIDQLKTTQQLAPAIRSIGGPDWATVLGGEVYKFAADSGATVIQFRTSLPAANSASPANDVSKGAFEIEITGGRHSLLAMLKALEAAELPLRIEGITFSLQQEEDHLLKMAGSYYFRPAAAAQPK